MAPLDFCEARLIIVGMEEIAFFNDVLKSLKLDATCLSYQEVNNYYYYDLVLNNKTKVKDIQKFSNEIALKLKASAIPNYKVITYNGILRLEFASNKNEDNNIFDLFSEGDEVPKGELVCLLGQAVNGSKIWMNLEDAPNLLVAGTTGSGKSVLLHNIIANLLFFNKAKIHLIDSKQIEFNNYSKLPNVQVGYTYSEALYTINSLILLMENRFALLRSGFKIANMPPVVLIIDEFADLVMQDSGTELYNNLLKLAQKCRAAKIHIVLATQRPSVNILNGAIKANFPARITCKVASHVDSKIVIDSVGAENLNGKGDALLKDNSRNFERFQIAYANSDLLLKHFLN